MERSLQAIFHNLQQEMLIKLTGNREIVPHAGEMGAGTELHWREWLDGYLPKRYKVIKGFVIDSTDTHSEQIDVIIVDRFYAPFLYARDGVYFVPAESVYAVLEVKQDLSLTNIRDAAQKISNVRGLKRTTGEVMTIDGNRRGQLKPILGAILTTESTWSPAFGEAFHKAIAALDSNAHIDIGLALRHGSFTVDAHEVRVCQHGADSLVYFFLQLLSRLQALGTAPPMDLNTYSRFIETECYTLGTAAD